MNHWRHCSGSMVRQNSLYVLLTLTTCDSLHRRGRGGSGLSNYWNLLLLLQPWPGTLQLPLVFSTSVFRSHLTVKMKISTFLSYNSPALELGSSLFPRNHVFIWCLPFHMKCDSFLTCFLGQSSIWWGELRSRYFMQTKLHSCPATCMIHQH